MFIKTQPIIKTYNTIKHTNPNSGFGSKAGAIKSPWIKKTPIKYSTMKKTPLKSKGIVTINITTVIHPPPPPKICI